MEVAKTNITRLPMIEEANQEELEKARKVAAEKINNITNRAKAAYYSKDDSITTIEDSIELISGEESSIASNKKLNKVSKMISSIVRNTLLSDNKSVTSLVI